MGWTRQELAARAAQEIGGEWVSLGAGIPSLVAEHLAAGQAAYLHENGALRLRRGRAPSESETSASELDEPMAYFGSEESFNMIRGGRIGLCLLGAMQVAANGDLANWIAPGRRVLGIGGAMDLVAGAKRLIVLMEHLDKNGVSKLVDRCDLPLTGARVVDRLITDLGVFDLHRGHEPLRLVELAPQVTVEEVVAKTAASLDVALASAGPSSPQA